MEIIEIAVWMGSMMLAWTLLSALCYQLVPALSCSEAVRKEVIYRSIKGLGGVLSCLVGAGCYYVELFRDDPITPYTKKVLLMFLPAFYTFDLLHAVYVKDIHRELFAHHVITIGLILAWIPLPEVFYVSDRYFSTLTFMEMPYGPQCAREVLRLLGLKNTKLFDVVETLFFYCFLACRGVLAQFTLFIPGIIEINEFHWMFSALLVSIWCISNFYVYKVYLKLAARLREKKEMLEKGVELEWFT